MIVEPGLEIVGGDVVVDEVAGEGGGGPVVAVVFDIGADEEVGGVVLVDECLDECVVGGVEVVEVVGVDCAVFESEVGGCCIEAGDEREVGGCGELGEVGEEL